MTMYAIDTLEYARKLHEAGLPQEVAEAVARANAEALQDSAEKTLATKQDLAAHPTKEDVERLLKPYATRQDMSELRGELKQEMSELRGELKQEMSELRGELKQEMSELRGELKQDLEAQSHAFKQDLEAQSHTLRQEMAELRGDMKLQKWVSGVVVVAVLIPLLRDLAGFMSG